jgi:hypothetical protein
VALLAGRQEPEQLDAQAVRGHWSLTLTELVAESKLAFACIYLWDETGQLQRVAATPLSPGTEWPLTDALAEAGPTLVDGPTVLMPLRVAAGAPAQGVLVAGADSSSIIDEPLIGSLTKIGKRISVMLASGSVHFEGQQRVHIMSLLDDTLQKLFIIGLVARATLADQAPDQVPDNIAKALAQIVEVATGGREHLRDAIFALRRGEAGEAALADTLRMLAHRFERRTGIDAEVLVNGCSGSLPAGAVETLEQTAAEVLGGIERQSKARAVILSLRVTARSVTLSVQDDGASITDSSLQRVVKSATYCGLHGVRQRVRGMGGTFVRKPLREGGFVVRARLPLHRGASTDQT